jgi:hypothetical protein
MGQFEDLAVRFGEHVARRGTVTSVSAERVLMVVYDKERERTLRARLPEFEIQTRAAGRHWHELDLTTAFARWMASLDYRETYFEEPEHLATQIEGDFRRHLIELLTARLKPLGPDDVLAVIGAASLYGFARLSDLIRDVEPHIRGCLAVFFPGTKDQNNYRLLDARDGWNYLAHSITLHSEGVH